MKITVYSTKTCPYCIMLKRWLDEKSIKYDAYNVEENPIAAQNMLIQSDGQMGVPFSTIELENNKIEKIFGFDRQKFEAVLKLKK